MKISRIINLLCIVIGGIIAIYAKAEEHQNTYLLIAGIVILVFGIYRTSRGIPSKSEQVMNEETKKEDHGF